MNDNREKIYIIEKYNNQIYYFILKRVKDKSMANDIMQNVFLKAFENLNQVEKINNIKAWLYQIARNEIVDYHKRESKFVEKYENDKINNLSEPYKVNSQYSKPCCFDNFVNNLPQIYKEPIELVYIKGLKQKYAADVLNISFPNIKARIRRAKIILKENFKSCCQYEINKNGKLIGESNCEKCSEILKDRC